MVPWIINTSVFKLITILVAGFVVCAPAFCQVYKGKNGKVKFFSEAPLENIEAVSNEANSVFKATTGAVAVLIPIRSFVFDKTLMRDHFNETYMESNKYPEATFVGKLEGGIPENVAEDKVVTVSGKLNLHGIIQEQNIQVTLKTDANGFLNVTGKFRIRLIDHKIKIPRIVFKNIAETVEVSFELKLKQIE